MRILSFACFSFMRFKNCSTGFLLGTIGPLARFPLNSMLLDAVVGCKLSVVVVVLTVVVFVVVVCVVSVGIVVEFSG